MSNFNGEYAIILDGKEVARSKNLITTAGKSIIKKFLIGSYPVWGSAIGLGVMPTAATAADTRLKFEADRRSITSKTLIRPKNYISSFTVSGTTTVTFTTVETNKMEVGDLVTVSGITNVGYTALNTTHTVTAVGTNSFSATISALTNTTNAATSATAIGEELVLLKASFPDSLSMIIKEIGVFPTVANSTTNLYNISLLSDFSEDGWTTAGATAGTETSLIGLKNIQCGTTEKTITGVSLVFDGYTAKDKIALLVNNATAVAKDVTVTFAGTTTKAFVFAVPATAGSQVIELDLGSHGLSTATSMAVKTSTGTVDLDAIALINADDYGVVNSIVSRSVLASPVTKLAGQQLEIEYSMRLS